MGVISDFVIAQPSEAAVVIEEPRPARRWRGIEAKGVDTIKLATLKFILEGRPPATQPVVDYSIGIRELAMKSDEGPFVFLVPDELILQLADVPRAGLAATAQKWHQTEEFQLAGWSESDVREFLGELHVLASEARSSSRSVLLFMSS